MAQVKIDCYKYTDEAEFLQSLTDSGYTLNGGEPLIVGNNIITDDDSGENLDMNYHGVIITNYPDTGGGWTPVMSTEVFMLCARKGNIKLPSNHKLTGQDRKYYYNYINVYAWETAP